MLWLSLCLYEGAFLTVVARWLQVTERKDPAEGKVCTGNVIARFQEYIVKSDSGELTGERHGDDMQQRSLTGLSMGMAWLHGQHLFTPSTCPRYKFVQHFLKKRWHLGTPAPCSLSASESCRRTHKQLTSHSYFGLLSSPPTAPTHNVDVSE